MTRRSFGLTVISACVAGSARAGGVTKWALLSDTHVSKTRSTDRGNENLQRVIGTIDRSFNGTLICGDLATGPGGNIATKEDYTTLKSLIDKVKAANTLLAMGNCDSRGLYLDVFGNPANRQGVKEQIVLALDADPVRLVVLDSSNGDDTTTPQTPATLGAPQLSWLQRYLQDHHDKPIILFTHYPAGLVDGQAKMTDGLVPAVSSPSTLSLKSILEADTYKSVKAIVSGHEHVYNPPTPWQINDSPSVYSIYLLGLPSVKPGATPYSGWVEASFETVGFMLTLRNVAGKGSLWPFWRWLS